MANLRFLTIKAIDSTTIRVRFSDPLNPLINSGNISIKSTVPNVFNPIIKKVSVKDDILVVKTTPMTPYVSYIVTFKSTDQVLFSSRNGQNVLFEDGTTNAPIILGPEEPDNEIRNILLNFQKDGVYNLLPGSLSRDIINSQTNILSRALYDIGQVKNDNYLQVTIFDERKERGRGPYDRLNEEGAFEVVRVGLKETGSTTSGSIKFSSFPSGPITLQANSIQETLTAGSGPGTFNNLTLTLSNYPVTKLKELVIKYQNGVIDNYSIDQFGYQLQNPRYDKNFASTFLLLENNQIQLNQEAVISGFRAPSAGDVIKVTYEYKILGKIVDENSVTVSQVLEAVREVVPPSLTSFSLAHAPIVNENNFIASSGGISFLNPISNPPFSSVHPAFIKEIPFRFERLPSNPGEYSVDYSTGRVFVYGENFNDGTGNFPPVATYKYRNSFSSRLDYTYNPDTFEMIANPLRDLTNKNVTVFFDYELTLVPGIDFEPQVHQESLNERIENRLNSINSLRVLNSPITNVFRVFNETTGEIYPITRFNNNSIFFNYRTPPRISDSIRERASFKSIQNEVLIVDNEFINVLGTRVLKILLLNNRIISSSEDVLGSSFNSSVVFSKNDIFQTELYFDGQVNTVEENIDRLTEGKYQVDYENGIIYVGVSVSQLDDLGTVNYLNSAIDPNNPHVIAVNEIYHSISSLSGISKRIEISSFDEGKIVPLTLDRADERFLNGDETLQYTVSSNTITVTDDIKNVRNIFDVFDLNNNESPTNFAEGSIVSGNVINLNQNGVQKQEVLTIGSGLTITAPFISNGIEISNVISVLRISDNQELYDVGGSFSGYDIFLSGVGSPSIGDLVLVVYNVKLNGSATPVIDYNRGDYFIDYTYVADEILVSYEYGDNVLDFRNSLSINEGQEYFVTYKVGALRDALLKNFGSLIDIPIINSFDTTLSREKYRDILKGSLQSFTRGPTIPAMKTLVSAITKIDPEILESIFRIWSLGISHLYRNNINYTGNIELVSSKFDNGALITNSDETITFPLSSNFRIEEGSIEFWVTPEWDGIDNDATLIFENLQKNEEALLPSNIFIGASSFNPVLDENGKFTINKFDEPSPLGLPNKIFTHTGLFIYYDSDNKNWKIYARDSVTDPNGFIYSGNIKSSGEVYNVKNIEGLGELNDVIRHGINDIYFKFNLDGYDVLSPDGYLPGDGYSPGDGYVPGYSFDGIQFMADDLHYFIDWAKEDNKNRFSIFKDGRGYLNLHVYDKNGTRYPVTTDISSWKAGVPHHIAASWKLNTSNRKDELHLFVDGQEVYNIMRFGGRPIGTSSDRFRTVKPEILIGTVPKNVVTGNDLITIAGSDIVESLSIDFDNEGILPGDSINILEIGFGNFNILNVSGRFLTLDGVMPANLSDARFSVNQFSSIVTTQIDLFTEIAVSIIDGYSGEETEIPGLKALLPSYTISKNLFNQNVLTLLGNAKAGDQVAIRTFGLNHRRVRDRQFIWGNSVNVIKTQLPPPISLDEVSVTKVLLPLLPIGPNNSSIISGSFVATGIPAYQPSNIIDGRTLSIRITGENVDFSTPVIVTINGNAPGGIVTESIVFNSYSSINTINKWQEITSVDVNVLPIYTNKNSISVEIKEAFVITDAEGNLDFPVIRYSYQAQSGNFLEGDGSSIVSDINGYFIDDFIGQSLVITSPGSVSGTYTIIDKIDSNTISISPDPGVSFSNGSYVVFNTSIGRSGFQNGFFTFETAGLANTPYVLTEGFYDFDYAAYLEIPLDSISDTLVYVGSDYYGAKQAGSVIDELRILTRTLDDVRVGESISDTDKSVTVDFLSRKPFVKDNETLMLIHFDNLPFINDSDVWVSSDREFIQSDSSINSNFEKSLVLIDRNLEIDNDGVLLKNQGSIEFWVSPRFDTFNDPFVRFYFDAYSAVTEELISSNRSNISLMGSASNIISVRLQTDKQNTEREYFAEGSLSSNGKIITLGKALPRQTTPVKVSYIPSGLNGDRISIFKDQQGFLNFNVRANGIDYQVRQPIFWNRDSWHRVMATYKLNSSDNLDEIRLFVDGEERGTILFGSGLLFGQGFVFGQGFAGVDNSVLISDINFSDPINKLFIGSNFEKVNLSQARYDNIRLSNTARSPLIVSGQAKDINFSTNRDIVLPVVEDLFTTKLLDFNKLVQKTDDLAILRDEVFGLFNFDITIIDSFDIVMNDPKVKQILEELISVLKPAQSRVNIDYIQ